MSQANHFIGGWDGWKHGQNKTSGTPTSLMIGYCRAKPTVALFCLPNTKRCYAIHRKLERDGRLPKRVKAARLASTGKLECEACEFDFAEVFGELGDGFIEAYHRVPVHKLDGTMRTKADDLALVCPNCHRMLHRSDPHLSVEQLRDLLTTRRRDNAG